MWELHLHAHFSRLARFAVVAGIALISALALVILVDGARPALAAQSCTTLSSGQIYCLTKTDAFDPIRVGGTQSFTIIESLSAGSLQVTDSGPLTDIVPTNYAITNVAATFVGSASGPPCTISGNTVTCPAPRTIGPGAGQIIVTITATAASPSTKKDKNCEAVVNTAFSTVPGVTANQVAEPTTILPEKGPAACGAKNTIDDDEDEKQETKEQKQNRRRTDNSNHDQVKTEGNVVGVRCKGSDAVPTLKRGFISEPDATPYALIGTKDGVQQIIFRGGTKSDCKLIQVGDYLEAEGEKEHEQLFYADNDVEIRRDGKRID